MFTEVTKITPANLAEDYVYEKLLELPDRGLDISDGNLYVNGYANVRGGLYLLYNQTETRSYLQFKNSKGTSNWEFLNYSDDKFYILNSTSSPVSYPFTINTQNYIGIKTTNPSHELDVNGTINLTGDLKFKGTAPSSGFLKYNGSSYSWENVSIPSDLSLTSLSVSTLIKGDFTSEPETNRTAFQTTNTLANSVTSISIIPGTGSFPDANTARTRIDLWSETDRSNSYRVGMAITNNQFKIISTKKGNTKTYSLPISFEIDEGLSTKFSGLHINGSENSSNTGYVGIGTSTPAYKLDVDGAIHTSGNIILEDNKYLKLSNNSSHMVINGASTWGDGAAIIISGNDHAPSTNPQYSNGSIWLMGGGKTSSKLYTTGFSTVGIATANPSSTYALDVNGKVSATAFYIGDTEGTASSQQYLITKDDAGNMLIKNSSSTNYKFKFNLVNDLYHDNTSNQGTGLFIWGAKSDNTIGYGGAFPYLHMQHNPTNGRFELYSGQSGSPSTSYPLMLGCGTVATAITINNSGNVGINTTSPDYQLDVNGKVSATAFYINDTELKPVVNNYNSYPQTYNTTVLANGYDITPTSVSVGNPAGLKIKSSVGPIFSIDVVSGAVGLKLRLTVIDEGTPNYPNGSSYQTGII